jgi:hypothetical protein
MIFSPVSAELRDLWTPTGLLLGFQVTFFKWRLEREAEVGDMGDIPWLVPSDYLSIFGMMCFLCGVFLLPLSGASSMIIPRGAFGLGTIMFVGQALGLAGHYQLFNRTKLREFVWFPTQERVVIAITLLVSAIYVLQFP